MSRKIKIEAQFELTVDMIVAGATVLIDATGRGESTSFFITLTDKMFRAMINASPHGLGRKKQ